MLLQVRTCVGYKMASGVVNLPVIIAILERLVTLISRKCYCYDALN